MTQHVIDHDPLTGVTETLRFEGDTVYHGFHQDADALERLVKRNEWERDQREKLGDDYFDHYAHIPITVQYEWLYKFGVDFSKKEHKQAWLELLERPEYKVWKTTNRTLVKPKNTIYGR